MTLYEHHNLTDDNPIIFHYDELNKQTLQSCFSNRHENIELLYCVSGKGNTVINGSILPMEEGSITVINSGRIHYITTETESLEYYCLIIDTEFLKRAGLDISKREFAEYMFDATAEAYFKIISSEQKEKAPYSNEIIKGNVIALAAYMLRKYSGETDTQKSDTGIKPGIEYIREHFREDISVEDVAACAGFSRFYFSRRFRETVGLSIKEYVQQLRCNEAKAMLMTNKYNVSEVSSACGFSDVSYFTKVFKKHFGCLPSKVGKG